MSNIGMSSKPGPVRAERVHAAISRARARSRSPARARHCSISRPYSSLSRMRSTFSKEAQLKADEPDRRVVVLRDPLRDGLPAGGVQSQGNARGVARAGIDDVERGAVAVVAHGESGDVHCSFLRIRAIRPSTVAESAPQASPQPRRLRSKSSTEPRWASKKGSSVVAARTDSPAMAIPVIAGRVTGFEVEQPGEERGEHGREAFAPARGPSGASAAAYRRARRRSRCRAWQSPVGSETRLPRSRKVRDGALDRMRECGQASAGPERLRAASSSSGPTSTMRPACRAASA